MSNFSDRALREQAQLDGNGLDRDLFTKVLSHANHYYRLRRREILRDLFRSAGDRHILEIGSQCWFQWMEGLRIKPETLICINISARAIQQGKQKARGAGIRPQFFLMDAHNLEFPDNSFDLVFGNAILHHLDLDQALDEIERVLRPAGKMVFCEPLGVNQWGRSFVA
jgi:ubiquinone/menaquinone biosynthesis C-methylase UbiE